MWGEQCAGLSVETPESFIAPARNLERVAV